MHGTPQKINCTHITYWQYHALQAGDTHTYTQIRQNIRGAFIDNDDVTLAHALLVSFLMLLCTPMLDLPNSHWQCSQPLLAGKYKTFGNGDLAAGHCKSKETSIGHQRLLALHRNSLIPSVHCEPSLSDHCGPQLTGWRLASDTISLAVYRQNQGQPKHMA